MSARPGRIHSELDIGANEDQGSAYVFVRPDGGWAGQLNETAKLTNGLTQAAPVAGFNEFRKIRQAVLGNLVKILGQWKIKSVFDDDVGGQ